MNLHAPLCITSRLRPGLRIADAEISICIIDYDHASGRWQWAYYINYALGQEHYGDDLSGHTCDPHEMMGTLLVFLEACAEAYAYTQRTGRESDNADLFPPAIAEWAYLHSDDLAMARMELEGDEA